MSNQLKTIILLGLLSGIIIVLGGLLGGRAGIILAFIISLVMNIGSYWFSDKIVLRIYHAIPLDQNDAPFLYKSVGDLAHAAGIPRPALYRIPQATPNAFATGRDPEHSAIAVTDGILQILSPEELRGVIAHEMGHIVNRDILIQTIAGVMASAIVTLASMFRFSAIFGGNRNNQGAANPLAAILLSLLAPLAASLIQMAISRSREYLADATGARLCGEPLALAAALYQLGVASKEIPMTTGNPSTAEMFIVAPVFSKDRSIANLFSTHPPLEERINKLRAMAAK